MIFGNLCAVFFFRNKFYRRERSDKASVGQLIKIFFLKSQKDYRFQTDLIILDHKVLTGYINSVDALLVSHCKQFVYQQF